MKKKEATNKAPSKSDKSIQRSAEALIANSQTLLRQFQERPDVPPH